LRGCFQRNLSICQTDNLNSMERKIRLIPRIPPHSLGSALRRARREPTLRYQDDGDHLFETSLRRALDRRVTIPSDGPVICGTSSLTLSSLSTGNLGPSFDLNNLGGSLRLPRIIIPNRAEGQLHVGSPTSGPRTVGHNEENFQGSTPLSVSTPLKSKKLSSWALEPELNLGPAVSLVSINPEGSHNHPARDARALAQGRLCCYWRWKSRPIGGLRRTRWVHLCVRPLVENRTIEKGLSFSSYLKGKLN